MNSISLNFAGVQCDETVNGTGLGMTIYFQGCSHHCKGCHNPETWEFGKGKYCLFEIISKINEYFINTPFAERITFSGGDPLDNLYDLERVLNYVKEFFPEKKLWLYTGYKLEDLTEEMWNYVKQFDFVVDGPFDIEKRDITLPFRGSSNQNITSKDALNLLYATH
jgi:anaerobic ribonucleoside-triphosphate reductase activating protein